MARFEKINATGEKINVLEKNPRGRKREDELEKVLRNRRRRKDSWKQLYQEEQATERNG